MIYSERRKCQSNPCLVYYSNVRMSTEFPALSDSVQLSKDVKYMEYLSQNGYSLTRRSLFMRWFPSDLQEVFEISAQQKQIDKDFDGILTLISFAGPEFGKNMYMKKMMKKGYGTTGRDMTRNSQRNLAFLLLGTVMDDVSEVRAT